MIASCVLEEEITEHDHHDAADDFERVTQPEPVYLCEKQRKERMTGEQKTAPEQNLLGPGLILEAVLCDVAEQHRAYEDRTWNDVVAADHKRVQHGYHRDRCDDCKDKVEAVFQ